MKNSFGLPCEQTSQYLVIGFRLSLANAVYENPSLPRRKILLSTGGQNYKPPLERSKSAPKLSAIEEDAAAEELEQARLLEELRSLRNVACSWPEQEDWRLARLVQALNQGNSGEFSDENGSISSGCETASTANSEERAPGPEDSNNSECMEPRSPRRVYFSDETLGSSRRRNSDGSPSFVTDREMFAIHGDPPSPCGPTPMFDFEDGEEEEEEEEDFSEEDVVDCSPRGEHPRRLQSEGVGRERRLKRADTFPPPVGKHQLRNEEDEFSTLDALDEEADSDESGYVEAPPKALLSEDEDKEKLGLPHSESSAETKRESVLESAGIHQRVREKIESKRPAPIEQEDGVKPSACPIAETIKKLANASLKTSKSLEISTNNCLKALNNLKSSKSFDSSVIADQTDAESPSLHQRKQLLAQQGVIV